MKHIELFAGCGGFSLGLQTAGFDLLMANELSPMAAETFAYNLLDVDLQKDKSQEQVIWLNSAFPRSDINSRLRENPLSINEIVEPCSDIEEKPSDPDLAIAGKLLVGGIAELNDLLSKKENGYLASLSSAGVDLVSGGPPCQSFSLAGLRDFNNHRNQLPWQFAKFVSLVKPKMALLENVTGILSAFKQNDQTYYAWYEVAKAFAKVGYVPLCLTVNAKNVGAAQNRPRFILMAFREDIYSRLKSECEDPLFLDAIAPSEKLLHGIQAGKNPQLGSIECFDIKKHAQLFSSGILSALNTHGGHNCLEVEQKNLSIFGGGESSGCPIKSALPLITVKAAINDLMDNKSYKTKYVHDINYIFSNPFSLRLNKMNNHEFRVNGPRVQARFRMNQIVNRLERMEASQLRNYMKCKEGASLNEDLLAKIAEHWVLAIDGNYIENCSPDELKELVEKLRTKKHSQRALRADKPAPAVRGTPDDMSHYHDSLEGQRTLTVRELARIQSFPDWFEFRSKVTTGGKMRRYEVPQYTQVANAVPPLLGLALGRVVQSLL